MAKIKAFRAMRYDTEKSGDISGLCCPPYDVISEEERLEYIAENEHNIVRLELPKEGENPYETAAHTLERMKNSGILKIDEKPAIYIYEEEFDDGAKRKSVKGTIARVRLEEFEKGVILPHELTLSKAKTDRMNLMKATTCNFSSVFALYDDGGKGTLLTIDKESSSEPLLEFTGKIGITHRLWAVTDQNAIAKLESDFADRKLYIADGHHRYETALNYRDYRRERGTSAPGDPCDFLMMYLVDMEHPGLTVYPTHRLVHGLHGFDHEKVAEDCEKYFDIIRLDGASDMETRLSKLYRDGKTAFGFYSGKGKSLLLVLKDIGVMDALLPNMSKASRRLDVTVLHALVLEKILGIDGKNMENQVNLTYTKQFSQAINGVDGGKYQCAFLMNPTKVGEIKDVAAAGEKMPQKSTYFHPKMITGMVMNDLEVE